MKRIKLLPVKRGRGSWICRHCEHPLNYVYLNTSYDLYWCPVCKKWRWTGWTIKWLLRKRKILNIDGPTRVKKGTLTIMIRKLDRCIEGIRERMDLRVKIYSCKEYTQEFLKSLIEGD